ncbi:unnamed protein product [Protopolystoma xenopodis]|uniref:Uncharacterized protein n=1 Tax=Protopolystoma xenopodis TaxID=117903 RepID=A0A3S5A4B1_9PLAT|nr:unnamed protein product [Protopolystoma xenopodis]
MFFFIVLFLLHLLLQVVADYVGQNQQYEEVANRKIDWVNEANEPPPDVPRCGFDGKGCPKNGKRLLLHFHSISM